MLTKVEAIGAPILAPLSMGFLPTDTFQILGCDGIGPAKASINTSPYFGEGEYFLGASVPKRNIVIDLGLNPQFTLGETYESLRMLLYKYFMPRSTITLRFASTHMPTVTIAGFVEDCAPNIFSKEPRMQLSILCPDPYFVSATPLVKTAAVDSSTAIAYEGTVACGYIMRMNPNATAYNGTYILYTDRPTVPEFSVTGLTEGDGAVQISTIKGNKYARRVSVANGSTYQNCANSVPARATFPQLLPNTNNLMYVGTTGWSGGTWTMTYSPRYGGI